MAEIREATSKSASGMVSRKLRLVPKGAREPVLWIFKQWGRRRQFLSDDLPRDLRGHTWANRWIEVWPGGQWLEGREGEQVGLKTRWCRAVQGHNRFWHSLSQERRQESIACLTETSCSGQ